MRLHTFVEKTLDALPETDCGACLRVRLGIGGAVLAVETALSKALGLTVGDKVGDEYNDKSCIEVEAPTVAETRAFMEQLGLSPEEFATAHGLDGAKFLAFLEQAPNDRLDFEAVAVQTGADPNWNPQLQAA